MATQFLQSAVTDDREHVLSRKVFTFRKCSKAFFFSKLVAKNLLVWILAGQLGLLHNTDRLILTVVDLLITTEIYSLDSAFPTTERWKT